MKLACLYAVGKVGIEQGRDCPARFAHYKPGARVPILLYHRVTVYLPGGGQVALVPARSRPYDVLCGLATGKFAVPQPPPPLHAIAGDGREGKARVPEHCRRRDDAALRRRSDNPTGHEMVLNPCPAYVQALAEPPNVFRPPIFVKERFGLNCASARVLPARQTVRFAMRLEVPRDAPAGRAGWSLTTRAGATASIITIHPHR